MGPRLLATRHPLALFDSDLFLIVVAHECPIVVKKRTKTMNRGRVMPPILAVLLVLAAAVSRLRTSRQFFV